MFKQLAITASVSSVLVIFGSISQASETLDTMAQTADTRLIQEPSIIEEPCLHPYATDADQRVPQIIPIDDCGNGGGGGPTGPSSKPTIPPEIMYDSYSRGGVKITWERSEGYGYSVRYHVEKRKNYGTWVEIYSGYGNNYIASDLTDGDYTFRVKASNTKGSSSYRTGYKMKVKSLPSVNFSSLYPGLEASRTGDAQFINGNKKFSDVSRGNNSGSTNVQLRTSDLTLNLGKGFGLTEGAYAPEAVCLETENLYVNNTALANETWDFEQVETTQELYRKLDLDISADLSLSIGAFGLNADGKYKLFRESQMKRDFSRVVVRWERRAERLDLESSEPLAIKDYWRDNYIKPYDGTTQTETHFRKQCGDKYLSAVVSGARLYVLLEIENEDASLTEMEDISYNAKLKIGEILNASSSGTISNETREFFESNRITLRVHTEGGSSVQAQTRTISINSIKTYVDNFIAGVSPDGYVALSKEFQAYPIPMIYNSLSYFDVYKDYRPEKAQLERWIALDHQVNARCYGLADVDAQISAYKYRNICHNARVNLAGNTEECSDSNQWASCVNPASTTLPDSFYNTIPNLYAYASPEYATSNISLHVSSCWTCQAKSKTVTALACLPQKECLIDKSKQYTDANPIPGNSAPKGAQVYVDSVHKPADANGTQIIRPEPDGTQCLSTRIYMKTKGRLSSSSAYYHGNQSVHGRCPVTDFFELP